MEERLDCLKESTINLVQVTFVILKYNTSYSGVKAYFILCGIHKQNKNLNKIIKLLLRL